MFRASESVVSRVSPTNSGGSSLRERRRKKKSSTRLRLVIHEPTAKREGEHSGHGPVGERKAKHPDGVAYRQLSRRLFCHNQQLAFARDEARHTAAHCR